MHIHIYIYKMEFKKLELEPETSWFKRKIWSQHVKKTTLYIILGAIAGFIFFYFTEGISMDNIQINDILRSTFIGGFFGFFITNSPCANNKC